MQPSHEAPRLLGHSGGGRRGDTSKEVRRFVSSGRRVSRVDNKNETSFGSARTRGSAHFGGKRAAAHKLGALAWGGKAAAAGEKTKAVKMGSSLPLWVRPSWM